VNTLSTTPAEGFPRSTAAAPTMAGYISTEQYLWGRCRVLDGITPGVAGVPDGSSGTMTAVPEKTRTTRRPRRGHDANRCPEGSPSAVVSELRATSAAESPRTGR
jgi:hypothetical protein